MGDFPLKRFCFLASSITSRTSFTPLETAESLKNFLPEFSEIISASVVFPVPGGPQKISDFKVSFSIIFRMVPFSPVRCSCPKTSSKVLGLNFSASGIFWFKVASLVFKVKKSQISNFKFQIKKLFLQDHV